MRSLIRQSSVVLICTLFVISTASAEIEKITAESIMLWKPLAGKTEKILNGEVVGVEGPNRLGDSEIEVLLALYTDSDMIETYSALRKIQESTEQDESYTKLLIENSRDLVKDGEILVRFSETDLTEVTLFLAETPEKSFNLGREDLALLEKKKLGLNGATDLGLAETLYSDVLKTRIKEYRSKGIDGIKPYIRNDLTIHIAEELKLATEAMTGVQKFYPVQYQCFRFFPDCKTDEYLSSISLLKQQEGGRALFMLKHMLTFITGSEILMFERYFYTGHDIEGLQIIMGLYPYKSGTLVVLLNQVLTEKVNVTFGKNIAKSIGRKSSINKMKPLFLQLQHYLRAQD